MFEKCWLAEGEIFMTEVAFLLRKRLADVKEKSALFILEYIMFKNSLTIKDIN